MTSILTNTAAMAALQTLRSVGGQLTQTQSQVSSGLRIGTASDNAAYWSIATTMRSDNSSISAVQDALGLGAAKLDVAYTGTSSIVDIISEFKAKLIAAKEVGVHRTKIQEELAQLNQQAESIVDSSTFSGVSWLRTFAPIHFMDGPELTTSLVSSFTRSDKGNVSVAQIPIDLKKISMLNEGGGGILQREVGSLGDVGGFKDSHLLASAHNGHEAHTFTGPATFVGADYIEFSAVVDAIDHTLFGGPLDPGVTYAGIRIDKAVVDAALGTTDGTIHNAAEMRKVLQMAFDNSGVPAWTDMPSGFTQFGQPLEFGSMETLPNFGSSINLFGFTSDFNGVHPAGFALGLEDAPPPPYDHDNMLPKASVNFSQPFAISGRATITFDVQIGNGPVQPITVTRGTVNSALGTGDGVVKDVDDFAKVLNLAVAGSGLIATSTDPEFAGTLVFRADPTLYPEAGNKAAHFSVTNVKTDPPQFLKFGLAEIDITTDKYTIDEYLEGIDYMLKKAIASASALGSLSARIDMQLDFAANLTDSLQRGVGRLVDADMNEASTRLKALETQQQLALQSLQIANSNSDNIMQLFR